MAETLTLCIPCQRGDHMNCEGDNLYGDPCDCEICEQQANEAAEEF